MNKRFLIIFLVAATIATILVVQATRQGSSLVLMPSELLAQDNGKVMTRLRVAGRVADQAIEYNLSPKIELKFSIHDPGKKDGQLIPVVYEGLKPDMFTSGRDVILDGEYRNGVFVANKLLTQCPSKYEPPDPSKMSKSGSYK
jgi:cytochrome c-type biogenesis protein CcmE